MRRIRVIPILLIQDGGLVKSVKFSNYKYVGDPINAVKIFNEKEVDELVLLDISATKEKRKPDIKKIAEIASEAFMPIAYGGGITSIEEVKELFYNGIEKVIINKSAHTKPALISEIAESFGSQSIVVSIDVKKNIFGKYRVFTDNGTKNTGRDPLEFAKLVEKLGSGEIILNSIDRDGTFDGYDIDLIKNVAEKVNIPVVAAGGASSTNDFVAAIKDGNASAVSAGSMFVFQRPHRAVLISYPNQQELKSDLFSKII